MTKSQINFYTRLAKGIAAQFGSSCETVVHDLSKKDLEHTIVAIENGHVSGRSIGDGPSHIVLESLQHSTESLEDKLSYLTRTSDGKVLKSSTIYIRDDKGKVIGIFGINFDISFLHAMDEHIRLFIDTEKPDAAPESITPNVSDLLDDLIEQALRKVGKPVSMMTKEDKVSAVKFLNDSGAFLITKSGPKVCSILNISKYTLYSYLEEIKSV
ncbi:MAG: helix-turn-helix transcriptional regulator [Lachnospiraceae bacterium]|nr:helix-turn-helix transcriptional regulator [Lachnospiraceae bacterium]